MAESLRQKYVEVFRAADARYRKKHKEAIREYQRWYYENVTKKKRAAKKTREDDRG